MTQATEPMIYQGQFGEFTINDHDRREVIIYRSGLAIAALCFAAATAVAFWQPDNLERLKIISPLYSIFCASLGVSLFTIHIYMKMLHRMLQAFWLIGVVASVAIAHFYPESFALTVYDHPLTLFGVGFVFAALTGIYFKEGVCFNRLETKILTPLVPVLLLGHLSGILSVSVEKALLVSWAVLFAVFAFRKMVQPIPPDIGDKSVFAYLRQSHQQAKQA
uniref:DUF2301 domain-containing membrane protein n=1 Tax=Oscillatoriales cyanobacterium SpSt-402 TaxID=2282168 RepID=A0A832H4E8_9CYAN